MKFHLNPQDTIDKLLLQEDTDGDKKITIEDKGPRSFTIISTEGEEYEVKGTYYLSNLLQELVITKNNNQTTASFGFEKIEELPVNRVSRMIKEYYWKGLTRTMDEKGIVSLIHDTKNETLQSDKLRIYIPFQDNLALKYYKGLENKLPIEAIQLPQQITPEFVKSINEAPGILALGLENGKGIPFDTQSLHRPH